MTTQERGPEGYGPAAGATEAQSQAQADAQAQAQPYAQSQARPAVGVQSYPCDACGATVEFSPGAGTLKCPYCGHERALAEVPRQVREHPIEELATLRDKPRALVLGEARAFVCPGCGARTETDDLSARCQFCATPLVADAEQTERVVPEAVVPFGLDRGAARDRLNSWTSSRWFAPSSLKKVTEAETFKGSYLPHWTYDAATTSHYQGQRGEHYYTTETYTATENGQQVTRTRQVRHTRWHHASGTVARAFDDILVAGTTHVKTAQLDKLTPWPLQEARPFQPEYLAGFQTVRYDVEPEQGLETAKQRMATTIESDCRADIGGDEQRVTSVDTRYDDVTYKLMLLPVWFLTYLHAGRSWQVMVNARTGEVIGDRPYSAAKITAAIAALVVLVAVIVAVVKLR
jgi:DNA-directed RNA polymerase subunit RPC12/RpoP